MKVLFSIFKDPTQQYFDLNFAINTKNPPDELIQHFVKPNCQNHLKNLLRKYLRQSKLHKLRAISIIHWILLYCQSQDIAIDLQNLLGEIPQVHPINRAYNTQPDIQIKARFNLTYLNTQPSSSKNDEKPALKTEIPQILKIIQRENTTKNLNKLANEKQFLDQNFIYPYQRLLIKMLSSFEMYEHIRSRYWVSHKLYYFFHSSQYELCPANIDKSDYLFNMLFYIRQILLQLFEITNKISTLGRYYLLDQSISNTVIFFVDMLSIQAVYFHDVFISILKEILTSQFDYCLNPLKTQKAQTYQQIIKSMLIQFLPEVNQHMRFLLQNKYFQPAYKSRIYTKLMKIQQQNSAILKGILMVIGYPAVAEFYTHTRIKYDLSGQFNKSTQEYRNNPEVKIFTKYWTDNQFGQASSNNLFRIVSDEKRVSQANLEFQQFIYNHYDISVNSLSQFVIAALQMVQNDHRKQQTKRQKSKITHLKQHNKIKTYNFTSKKLIPQTRLKQIQEQQLDFDAF